MAAAQIAGGLLHSMWPILPIVALLVFVVPRRWRTPEVGPMVDVHCSGRRTDRIPYAVEDCGGCLE
jgi:hypothetical protein